MKENIQIFHLKVVHATVHELFGSPDILMRAFQPQRTQLVRFNFVFVNFQHLKFGQEVELFGKSSRISRRY